MYAKPLPHSQPMTPRFKLKPLILGFLAVGMASHGAGTLALPRASLDALDVLGGVSRASGINDSGQVVGWSDAALDFHAVLWNGGIIQDLGTLSGNYSYAYGINDSDQVVGYSANTAGNPHAVLWHNGSFQDLGTLDSSYSYSYSYAYGINESGQVVGNSTSASSGHHAFLWNNGSMQDLGTLGGSYSYAFGINDSGQVVGYANTASGPYHAFLWSNGSMQDIGTLGGNSSRANGINDSGQVVGYAYTASGYYHAFLWQNGSMQDLGTLGGNYSEAYDINASGQVVGASNTIHGGSDYAVLWNNSSPHDLNALATANWTFTEANAINAYAQIAGTGNNNGNYQAYRLTLHPDWQGGNGYWSDASHWNFADMGSFGITPGQPHDVVINPSGSATVYGPSNATVNSLAVSGNGSSLVTLNLNAGGLEAISGTTLGNNGTLAGSGRLGGDLTIEAGGRVQVGNFDRLQLAGTVENAGRIDVQSVTARPNLEIGGGLSNATGSSVNLMNADLFVHDGISNQGRISMTGLTSISGTVDNLVGGQLAISGIDSPQAIFWDNFTNNGAVTITGGSTATFFGEVNGGGIFAGSGTKQFAGGYLPGNSPAQTLLEGSIEFLYGDVVMELAGTTPGIEHDKIVFTGDVSISESVGLNIIYLSGWSADVGDVYDLFDWGSSLTGSFGQIYLPTLASGLSWDVSNLYNSGEIRVNAVPLPAAQVLMLSGLSLLGFVGKRRKASMAS